MEEKKQETKKSALKKVVLWIAGIWALLTFAGFVIELFMYITVGGEIDPSKLLVGTSAGVILVYLYVKRGRLWTTNLLKLNPPL